MTERNNSEIQFGSASKPPVHWLVDSSGLVYRRRLLECSLPPLTYFLYPTLFDEGSILNSQVLNALSLTGKILVCRSKLGRR